MDLVFSDSGDAGGGFVDNNNGLEYHIPMRGSTTPQHSLRVTHVSVEMAPIAKVTPDFTDVLDLTHCRGRYLDTALLGWSVYKQGELLRDAIAFAEEV